LSTYCLAFEISITVQQLTFLTHPVCIPTYFPARSVYAEATVGNLDAFVLLQINYWVIGEQNETMALFRIIRNQTDHGLIIALREDTDYWVNVQVLNSGLNLGPKSEIYPVRTLRAGNYNNNNNPTTVFVVLYHHDQVRCESAPSQFIW